MKKLIPFIFALTILAAGCSNEKDSSQNSSAGDNVSVPDNSVSDSTDEVSVPISSANFALQTSGYHEDIEFPVSSIILSVDDLNEFYASFGDDESLEDVKSILGECDDYFFSMYSIAIYSIQETSGSPQYKLTSVFLESDGSLTFNGEYTEPEIQTDDMAEWHFISLISLEDTEISEDAKITLNFNLVEDEKEA